MKVPYTSTAGSLKLTPLNFQIALNLCNSNPELLVKFLTHNCVVSTKDAESAVQALICSPNTFWDNIITWSTPKTIEIPDAEYWLVRELCDTLAPRKVTAIKFIRAQHSLTLREAKDICDWIAAQ